MPNVDGLIGSDGKAYLDRIATAVEAIADSKNAPKLEDQRNELFAIATKSAQMLNMFGLHLQSVIDNPDLSALTKAQEYRNVARDLHKAGAELMPKPFDQ